MDETREMTWLERNKDKLIALGLTAGAILLLAMLGNAKVRNDHLQKAGLELFTKYCEEHARAELFKEMLEAAKATH